LSTTLCLSQQLPESDIGDTFPTYAPLWLKNAAGSLGGQANVSPPTIHPLNKIVLKVYYL